MKNKLLFKIACIAIVVIIIFLIWCNVDNRADLERWWYKHITDMSNGELFITATIASYIGCSISK